MIPNFTQYGAIAATLIISLTPISSALATPYDADRLGGKDHPVISRYAGSTLYLYGNDNYGSAKMLVADKGKPVAQAIDGKISNRIYFGPKGKSSLEIYRNYQTALTQAGFAVVYQCETEQCEKDRVQATIVRWPQDANWIERGDPYIQRIFEYKPFFNYVHARKVAAGGTVDIQIALRAGDEDDKKVQGRSQQFVQIVESAVVETGKVTVDAKAIGDSLNRDGKIALYGILFDTNKTAVKAESAATLDEMAKVLKTDPALKVFIVGHTDNQGNVDANVILSQKRAEAVVEILTKRHGIAADRLQARGVANFSPVSNNGSDPGRAKNRRVEMVVR